LQLASSAFVVLEIALEGLLQRLIVLLNSQVQCLAFGLHCFIGRAEYVIDACNSNPRRSREDKNGLCLNGYLYSAATHVDM